MKKHLHSNGWLVIICSLAGIFCQTALAEPSSDHHAAGVKGFIIQISLERDLESILLRNSPHRGEDGISKFGIPDLDSLIKTAEITHVEQSFAAALEKSEYSQRHHEWGFHLWYDLYVAPEKDIPLLLKAFRSIPGIDQVDFIKLEEFISPEVEKEHTKSNSENSPNDIFFSKQWHLMNTGQLGGTTGADIKIVQAWEIEKGNPDVIVAVISPSIDIHHPDLKPNLWDETGHIFSPEFTGWDPSGTHIAGIIAARTNNSTGVSGIAGGWGDARGASIMALQASEIKTAEALVWAADRGAAIAHIPSPSKQYGGIITHLAIEYFNTFGGGDVMKGGLVIASAGNENKLKSEKEDYANVLKVAGTNYHDKRTRISDYSPWVDISAPGGDSHQWGPLSTVNNHSYAYVPTSSGASVAGIAALVLSANPGIMNRRQLWDLLEYSADEHYDVNQAFPFLLGSGRVNALKALELAPDFYLPGKPNALMITQQTTSSVSLNWQLNDNGDKGLLVFSHKPAIRKPMQGITYSVGDTLESGAIVVAAGHITSLQHTGLEAGTYYYYRLWSVDEQARYSLPRSVVAATELDVVDKLPYSQDFLLPYMPPGWTQLGNSQVWDFGTSLLWELDGNSALVNYSPERRYSELISPVFNLEEYLYVKVSFDYILHGYNGNYSFLWSKDGGINWEQVAVMYNNFSYQNYIDKMNKELEAGGYPEVQFKWVFDSPQHDWFIFDNFLLDGYFLDGRAVVQAHEVSDEGLHSASLHGVIVKTGETEILEMGFMVSTNPEPKWEDPEVLIFEAEPLQTPGPFQVEANGLQHSRVYYVSAYARNSNGLFISKPIEFVTQFALPLFEDFEAVHFVPPPGWHYFTPPGYFTYWAIRDLGQGNHLIYKHASVITFYHGNNSDLISPVLHLRGENTVRISFLHYFLNTCEAEVSVFLSRDQGETWTQMQNWTQTSEINPSLFETIISDLSGNEKLVLKWNASSPYTCNFYWGIDDVAVEPLLLPLGNDRKGTNQPLLQVYPNPAQNLVNIKAINLEGEIRINLLNLQGQVLDSKLLDPTPDLPVHTFSLGEYPPGLYLINIITRDGLILGSKFSKIY